MIYNMVCEFCESDDIVAETTAIWSVDEQKWIETDSEYAFWCNDCMDNTRIKDLLIDPEGK